MHAAFVRALGRWAQHHHRANRLIAIPSGYVDADELVRVVIALAREQSKTRHRHTIRRRA